eukprot:gene4-12810_t
MPIQSRERHYMGHSNQEREQKGRRGADDGARDKLKQIGHGAANGPYASYTPEVASPGFTQWCADEGVCFHNITCGYVAEGWRGIVATAPIESGSVLLEVPQKLLLGRKSAENGDMAKYLAAHAYLTSNQLPKSYTTLAFFSDSDIEQLQLAHAVGVAEEAVAACKDEWMVALPLLRDLGLPKKYLSFGAWKWAASSLASRTMFMPDDPAGVMTPFGDLHNYRPPAAPFTPNVLLEGQPEEGAAPQSPPPHCTLDSSVENLFGCLDLLKGLQLGSSLDTLGTDGSCVEDVVGRPSGSASPATAAAEPCSSVSTHCTPGAAVRDVTELDHPSASTDLPSEHQSQQSHPATHAATATDCTGNGGGAVPGDPGSNTRQAVLIGDWEGSRQATCCEEAGGLECASSIEEEAYEEGDEVFLCYGRHTNLELLEHYGFILTHGSNPHDTALLPVEGVVSVAGRAGQVAQREGYGYGGPLLRSLDCFVHSDGHPSWGLLRALRTMAATPLERKQQSHHLSAGERCSLAGDVQAIQWFKLVCLQQLMLLPTSGIQDELVYSVMMQEQQEKEQGGGGAGGEGGDLGPTASMLAVLWRSEYKRILARGCRTAEAWLLELNGRLDGYLQDS